MPAKTRHALKVTLVMVGAILLWQFGVMIGKPPAYLLPTPLSVGIELLDDPLWYLSNTMATIGSTLLGFLLALVVGLLAAIGIVYSKLLESTLYTLLVTTNSVPKIAVAPLFIIWLGTGEVSKVAISFLIALFAIVVDAVLGLRSVDPDAVDLFRTMHGSRLQTLLRLRLPNALPQLFSGMKVAISLALVGAIAGEFVASENGLGHVILQAEGMFQTVRVFAAIVLLGVFGTLLFYAVEVTERLVCPWHVSHRGKARPTA